MSERGFSEAEAHRYAIGSHGVFYSGAGYEENRCHQCRWVEKDGECVSGARCTHDGAERAPVFLRDRCYRIDMGHPAWFEAKS